MALLVTWSWVILVSAALSTAVTSSASDADHDRKLCPNVWGCTCDFGGNKLTCRNVTSWTTLRGLPEWIQSISLEGWNKNFTQSQRYELPVNNMSSVSIHSYDVIDLRHFYISPSTPIRTIMLDNEIIVLHEDLLRGLTSLSKLVLRAKKVFGITQDLLLGLRLQYLTLSGNVNAILLEKLICIMDNRLLVTIDLSDNGLETIPEALVKCVPKVRHLTLNGNNFWRPGCLHSLSQLGGPREISLYLKSCNITSSWTLVFMQKIRLRILSLRHNDIGHKEMRKIVCFLDLTVLRNLNLRSNYIGDIDSDYFSCGKNISNASKLKQLNLSRGNISSIAIDAFRPFQSSRNVLIELDHNAISNVSFLLAFKRGLWQLNLRENKLKHVPSFRQNGKCLDVYPSFLKINTNQIQTVYAKDLECLPRLQGLDLSSNSIKRLTTGALRNLTGLHTLSLGSNPLQYLYPHSLPRNLLSLDLSKNFLSGTKAVKELGYLTKLEELTISSAGGVVFSNSTLKTLKVLSVSKWTHDEDFIREAISRMKNIQRLTIKDSNIKSIPYKELQTLEHLTHLDLSSNRILTIDHNQIQKMPTLQKLRVSSNRFECDCALVPFSDWLRRPRPRILISDLFNLQCASPSVYVGVPLFNFDRDCRSMLLIILPATLCPLVLVIAIVTFVSVRYRGYIRYGYLLIRARWRGYGSIEGHTFKWDAFISFNAADEAWVDDQLRPRLEDEAGYRICLHHRDFTIGEFITDNIVKCIDRSRKTLLILSDDFAKSQWCQLELSFAQHKLFYDDRDVLILVKLRDVSPEHFTGTMKLVMRTKTYITWSDDVMEQDLFWKQLILALRRPPGVGLEELEEWEVANNFPEETEQGEWSVNPDARLMD